ncbi:MAG TPA: nucleotide pyrophosphohydrolase [Candidatus Babeliales bacterium]|nr:nucleotide pyrophosphohydrolase [Candidatus Babeliales bacterium]
MKDQKTTIEELKKMAKDMVEERDWLQFHSPKNLACAISVEASELLEKFTFMDSKESSKELESNRQEIEDELADVIIASLCFANVAKIDLTTAIANKFEEIKAKYPVELCKGKKDKYTAYKDMKKNYNKKS